MSAWHACRSTTRSPAPTPVETFVGSAGPPEAPWAVFVARTEPVAGVATALLGDACVVYHPLSKVVVRLNDTGSALWLDLCEGEPLGADHLDFLHRLASLGLVAPPR